MNIDHEIKLYLKHIKLLLPAYNHPEKQYLTDIENRIQDILQENCDITIKDIEDQLGTPLEMPSVWKESGVYCLGFNKYYAGSRDERNGKK